MILKVLLYSIFFSSLPKHRDGALPKRVLFKTDIHVYRIQFSLKANLSQNLLEESSSLLVKYVATYGPNILILTNIEQEFFFIVIWIALKIVRQEYTVSLSCGAL